MARHSDGDNGEHHVDYDRPSSDGNFYINRFKAPTNELTNGTTGYGGGKREVINQSGTGNSFVEDADDSTNTKD